MKYLWLENEKAKKFLETQKRLALPKMGKFLQTQNRNEIPTAFDKGLGKAETRSFIIFLNSIRELIAKRRSELRKTPRDLMERLKIKVPHRVTKAVKAHRSSVPFVSVSISTHESEWGCRVEEGTLVVVTSPAYKTLVLSKDFFVYYSRRVYRDANHIEVYLVRRAVISRPMDGRSRGLTVAELPETYMGLTPVGEDNWCIADTIIKARNTIRKYHAEDVTARLRKANET